MNKIISTAAAILAAAVFVPVQSFAHDRDLAAPIAPPTARHEFVPPSRHGYEWAPGFWNWNGRKHVWTKGHWERARAGYGFHAPAWEPANGTWRLNRGGWVKSDRDHDGVSDRADHHPSNPMRR